MTILLAQSVHRWRSKGIPCSTVQWRPHYGSPWIRLAGYLVWLPYYLLSSIFFNNFSKFQYIAMQFFVINSKFYARFMYTTLLMLSFQTKKFFRTQLFDKQKYWSFICLYLHRFLIFLREILMTDRTNIALSTHIQFKCISLYESIMYFDFHVSRQKKRECEQI